jgi:hypothetical protein
MMPDGVGCAKEILTAVAGPAVVGLPPGGGGQGAAATAAISASGCWALPECLSIHSHWPAGGGSRRRGGGEIFLRALRPLRETIQFWTNVRGAREVDEESESVQAVRFSFAHFAYFARQFSSGPT